MSKMEQMKEENKLSCALCNAEPHVHCESDEAYLCYACDARVHGANFLVARHTRVILCRKCRSPTRVHASGPSLDKAIMSTCTGCADIARGEVKEPLLVSVSGSSLDLNSSLDEEEGENHVVPSSVDEAAVTGWKRARVCNGFEDQKDTPCCSTSDPSQTESLYSSDDDATSSSSDFTPRAHKRPFFVHVFLTTNSAEPGCN